MCEVSQLESSDRLVVIVDYSKLHTFPAQFEIGWCTGRSLRKEWRLLPAAALVPIDFQVPEVLRQENYGVLGLPNGKFIVAKMLSGGPSLASKGPTIIAKKAVVLSLPRVLLRPALVLAAKQLAVRLSPTSLPHVEII